MVITNRIQITPVHTYIASNDEARALSEVLVKSGQPIGFDTETSDLDPFMDDLRLVQLSTLVDGQPKTWLIDCFWVDVSALRLALEKTGPLKLGHNLDFDWRFLRRHGIIVGPLFDTMIVDQLLKPSLPVRNADGQIVNPGNYGRRLQEVVQEYLGIQLSKESQLSDWSRDTLDLTQRDYAAWDAAVLVPLWQEMTTQIQDRDLVWAAEIENQAVPAIAWMRFQGVYVDADVWYTLAKAQREELVNCNAKLDELTVGLPDRPINWNSAPQVRRALNRLGAPVSSTAEDELIKYKGDHPIVSALLEQRQARSRSGTYGADWLAAINPYTGRIHPRWNQWGSRTGRVISSHPNLQNIPRAGGYRECVRPFEDGWFCKGDFSQQEPRFLAEISGDVELVRIFNCNEDLYNRVSELVLGIVDRNMGKLIFLSLAYGGGAKQLQAQAFSRGIIYSLAQAGEIRQKFLDVFPGVARWQSLADRNIRRGHDFAVRSLSGRRRAWAWPGYLPVNEIINAPLQGSGADCLKLTLAGLWDTWVPELEGCFPVMTIHDEVIVEAPDGKQDLAAAWLKQAMTQAMGQLVAKVPPGEMRVQICKSYAGIKEVD
jgi:DNA polymerase-1